MEKKILITYDLSNGGLEFKISSPERPSFRELLKVLQYTKMMLIAERKDEVRAEFRDMMSDAVKENINESKK